MQLSVVAQNVVVSADRMNVAYLGIPNEMNIQVHGARPKNINVSVQSGQLYGGGIRYVWFPDSLGVNVVKVVRKRWLRSEEIEEFNIRVKRLPEPRLVFSDLDSGFITRRDLLASLRPTARCFNFEYNLSFIVTGFSISIYRDKGVPLFHNVYYEKGGMVFDQSLRDVFAYLRHGDRLIFYDIVCMRSDGKAAKVPDTEFVVAH